MTDIIEHNGLRYKVTIERDDFIGAPWDECDGHGPVSEWTSRAKQAGELVLAQDRGSYRYYDFAEACRIALRDGWDAKPYNTGQETKRQQAAKAARSDYEYLRRWCADDWQYVVVTVASECSCCGDFTGETASLGGVEDSDPSYIDDIVSELIKEVEPSQAA